LGNRPHAWEQDGIFSFLLMGGFKTTKPREIQVGPPLPHLSVRHHAFVDGAAVRNDELPSALRLFMSKGEIG
jgi:hypothetical protein